MKHTINDIAKLAGVSKATVSRVLNNSKPVSLDVKNKVLQVIHDTNFKPSQLARSLSNKQTLLIGVIVPDLSNPIFSQVINGIELEGIKKGYNILLCNSKHQLITEINCLDILMDKEIDGLIYNGFKFTDDIKNRLTNINIPIVMIGIGEENSTFPIVKIDNYQGAFDATEYLISNGHRKISMIRGPLDDPYPGKLRFDGFIDALKKNNIEVNHSLILEGNYKISDGYRAMSSIFNKKDLPTAVFCANDEMAIGVIKCITDHGLNVPNNISVIGFDDIEISKIFNPSLTTVSQSFFDKGKSAMDLIIKMINKQDIPMIIEHKHKIIIRETVKKI